MMSKTTRYMPEPVAGTSGADHLSYEVMEQLQATGYATPAGAVQAWWRACRRANARRKAQGYTAVSRPSCVARAMTATEAAQC